MNRCPECETRVPLRRVAGAPPYSCPNCGAALEFVPWRAALANLLCLTGATVASHPVHGPGRFAVVLGGYAALALLVWPFVMRLRLRISPERPLSIR